jgi:tetratricopeptide (TPR) repeat protein
MTLRYPLKSSTRYSFRSLFSLSALVLAASTSAHSQATLKPRDKSIQLAPPTTGSEPDRASAYYHDGLAHLYEELAINNGRPDYATQAVEEYKLALTADPASKYLQDGLADLYFKIGRIREAVTSAQDQIKKNPNDIAAHQLLGRVYLRSLGDMQGPQANEMLQLAIAEYKKLAQLQPKDLETHLLLGQLYGLNHETAKAEAEFKLAQGLDSNSEDAVLNMARLYSEQGNPQQAVEALTAIPADDRSSRINFALAASYDQLKKIKEAIAAYRAVLDEEPDNTDALHALGTDLLADNQLAAALPIYQQLVTADANDIDSMVRIADIQRQQGHYDDALATLTKAKTLNGGTENLELAYNESLLYDALGKYDQAVAALQNALNATRRSIYSEPEKRNRSTFLDRLGIVYREQNKTAEAVSTYKLMVDLGGDFAVRGYDGEIEAYRDAHQYKDALAVAAEAAAALPKDRRVQLMYASQLADNGDAEKSLAISNAQLTNTPDDRETLFSMAVIDLRLHKSADAMANLNKADSYSTTPDEHLGIDLMKATVLDHDKQYDAAEAEYRKALAIDPENPTVLNDLGYMWADHGVHLDEALKMIQKAVELDPQNGAYLDSLGWVYFKLGQYGPAEENLHKAIDRTATDASIHDHLGQVYEATGRLQLAVSQWERSMTEYAHSLPADVDPADIAKVKRKLDDARVKLAKLNSTTGKKS